MRRLTITLLAAVWMVHHDGLRILAICSTATAPLTPDQTAELWNRPREQPRPAYWGVGGAFASRLIPTRPGAGPRRPNAPVSAMGIDRSKGRATGSGASSAPPEASTEVVASRLLWGSLLPPAARFIYVGRLERRGGERPEPAAFPARFRESKPKELHGLDAQGHLVLLPAVPFVGTRELNGLLVLQVMLRNAPIRRTSRTAL